MAVNLPLESRDIDCLYLNNKSKGCAIAGICPAPVSSYEWQPLENRYNLTPQVDSQVTMSCGKSVPVGPTAKLPQGERWEQLASITPTDSRQRGLFPYPPLLHPKQTPGSRVFPQMQTAMFPHLERFDVEFDWPEAFPPEFPPAIVSKTGLNLGTSLDATSSQSPISTACSKTSSRQASLIACACS
jgi:hypothetical protein